MCCGINYHATEFENQLSVGLDEADFALSSQALMWAPKSRAAPQALRLPGWTGMSKSKQKGPSNDDIHMAGCLCRYQQAAIATVEDNDRDSHLSPQIIFTC